MESYIAITDAALSRKNASSSSPFKIEIRFLQGLNDVHKHAFKTAADRWCKIITGDLPSIKVDGEEIDDILILAEGATLDGTGAELAISAPTDLRPASAGKFAYLPAKGVMKFDIDDLKNMERKHTLVDVITHEMGHVLGFGFVWAFKNLIDATEPDRPSFIGESARIQYGKLLGLEPTNVPIENVGIGASLKSHWKESIFGTELMSSVINGPSNPLSAMTVASFGDIGYDVNIEAAEHYVLRPNNDFVLSKKEAPKSTCHVPYLSITPRIIA